METIQFTVPVLNDGRSTAGALADDLGNTLTSLSGVAHAQVSPGSSLVSVEYDSTYVTSGRVRRVIENAGFTVESSESTT